MSDLTRVVNRVLGQAVGVQVVPARTRAVVLDDAWFVRLLHFNRLVGRVSGIEGDVVECGVATGSSLATLAGLVRANGQSRQLWGFDSWTGLPDPSGADAGSASIAEGGLFAEASMAKVREELLAYGLSPAEVSRTVRLVPGLFSQTLPSYRGRIALLHVDVDLYQSYLDCLTSLWPHIQTGGVAAFDEYGEVENWPGAKRAVDEFLADHAGEAGDLQLDERSGKWWVAKTA